MVLLLLSTYSGKPDSIWSSDQIILISAALIVAGFAADQNNHESSNGATEVVYV